MAGGRWQVIGGRSHLAEKLRFTRFSHLAEMSRFTRFARHKMYAIRHLKLFCTPVSHTTKSINSPILTGSGGLKNVKQCSIASHQGDREPLEQPLGGGALLLPQCASPACSQTSSAGRQQRGAKLPGTLGVLM